MTRLQRIINSLNEYDDLLKECLTFEGRKKLLIDNEYLVSKQNKLSELRLETSLLIGELKRYGRKKEN